MHRLTPFLLTLVLGLALGVSTDAQAKRLGGGGSFGGKSAFSSPYKRSTAARPAPSPRQQQAVQQNARQRDALARRGGLMGMLGGLAIGGLLGALLFGGAFESINFLDLLVFGGLAYLLYRLFALRAGQSASRPVPAHAAGRSTGGDPGMPDGASFRGGFDSRDWFRGTGSTGSALATSGAEADADADFSQAAMPAGFDERAFLAGARIAYRDLQQAWDANDLDTLRGLTTPVMFDELARRRTEQSPDNRTDVLKVEAELLDAREVGDELEAVVLFDCILREAADEQARQVREVWHFTRSRASTAPRWYLDGIQQLED